MTTNLNTISGINLNDPEYCNGKDLCAEFDIDDSILRKRVERFPEGSIRKFGGNWVVLRSEFEEIMRDVKPRKKRKKVQKV